VVTSVTPDLRTFWTKNFGNWGWTASWREVSRVGFYNTGPYDGYVTPCGGMLLNNAFYCSGDRGIYFDRAYMQRLLNAYGDGAVALVAAHEYGHHIHYLRNRGFGKASELASDCMAGMYFRWGYQYSGILDASDIREARNVIWGELGGDPTGHGTREQRLAWFDYGYRTYNINSCFQAYSR
jgi:hypothetical protein